MAIDESELPPLKTEQDAVDRIETVIQAVADGRLEVEKAVTSVRATAVWYYLHRQDQERTRLTRAVRRAAQPAAQGRAGRGRRAVEIAIIGRRVTDAPLSGA